MGKQVFVSWSGGKDSYLALLRAQEAGLEISTLVTFVQGSGHSKYHNVRQDIMARQAAAMGLSLETEPQGWKDNGAALLRVMKRLKARGISGGVFGDINYAAHRELIEWVCKQGEMTMHMPLWGMGEEEVLQELQNKGCKLVITALRHDLMDKMWLGRELDSEFIQMCKREGISPCGERGEYHTLAVDGPMFNKPLLLKPRNIVQRRRMAFLDFAT